MKLHTEGPGLLHSWSSVGHKPPVRRCFRSSSPAVTLCHGLGKDVEMYEILFLNRRRKVVEEGEMIDDGLNNKMKRTRIQCV